MSLETLVLLLHSLFIEFLFRDERALFVVILELTQRVDPRHALRGVVRTVKIQLQVWQSFYQEWGTAFKRTFVVLLTSIRNAFHAENVGAGAPAAHRLDADLITDAALVTLALFGGFKKASGSNDFVLHALEF